MRIDLDSNYDKVNIDGFSVFIDNFSMMTFKAKDEVHSFTVPLDGEIIKISSSAEIAINNLKSFGKTKNQEVQAITFDQFSFDEEKQLYILKKDCCSLEMRNLLVMFKNDDRYIVTSDSNLINQIINIDKRANLVILNDIDVKTMIGLTEIGKISVMNISFDIIK